MEQFNKPENSEKFSYPNSSFKLAVGLGIIGFICGFIGPMIILPNSNLGPAWGILITGPFSFIIGLILKNKNSLSVRRFFIISIWIIVIVIGGFLLAKIFKDAGIV